MKTSRPVITLLIGCTCTLALSQAPAGRWSEAEASEWYAKQPWLVGSNYIPANAINELEMWQALLLGRFSLGEAVTSGSITPILRSVCSVSSVCMRVWRLCAHTPDLPKADTCVAETGIVDNVGTISVRDYFSEWRLTTSYNRGREQRR